MLLSTTNLTKTLFLPVISLEFQKGQISVPSLEIPCAIACEEFTFTLLSVFYKTFSHPNFKVY